MTGGRGRALFLNPYFQLGLSAVLITAAEVLLKHGAVTTTPLLGGYEILGLGALVSGTTWLGIALLILSFASWVYVLRALPLTQAYALISIVHILVPAAAWLLLSESISLTRGAGIALVLGGTILVAAPAAKAEEEL
jgi:drug/metabolite transporter (DMT)-like permease